jgi:RND family efflux transporter MFP subunit
LATPAAVFSVPVGEFLAALVGEREVQPRAQFLASEVAERIPGTAVIVYLLDQQANCAARAHAGDIKRPRRPFPPQGTTLERAITSRRPVIFSAKALPREIFHHLDLRKTVEVLAYLPLFLDEVAVGVVEIISYASPIEGQQLADLQPIAELAALALASSIAYESERNTQLKTISRLTQLYDLERTFNSTLNMDHLLPLITSKVREALEVEAVNLWMIEGEEPLLMNQSGEDPTVELGSSHGPGAAVAKEVCDTAKSVLATSPSDPRLQARNKDQTPAPVRSVLAVPILSQNFQVGVLEIVNKTNGQPFNKDDGFYLATISVTAGSALHNASLLEAEKKIEILETLVHVSREITSTLNLERVLQVIVNGSQKIVSYDRAAIALQHYGSLQVRAISGKTDIVQQDPVVRQLRDVLTWASVSEGELYITQHEDLVEADREEAKRKFKDHFAATGFRAWYSIRLEDDQGQLGVLSLESCNPDFLSDAQLEFIKVVAGQATVSIRNASLYKEVPLIGVLEPIIQKKQRFLRTKNQKTLLLWAAIVAAVSFIAVPLPMRVAGDVSVAPLSTAHIEATVPGVVERIFVSEGERVKGGQLLAQLDSTQYRFALAAAQARYNAAMNAMNAALAHSDGTEAGIRRTEADYWASETARMKERLERTRFTAPFDGVVVGPNLDTSTGRQLQAGDTLCDVVDTKHARVNVQVDEDDLSLVREGETTAVKLDAYPLRTFDGQVALISPTSVVDGNQRAFLARISVPNERELLRGGMRGRGKIKVGWRPSGYVVFRGLASWAWAKAWSMFGG